jgi:hypothetical protein
VIEEALRREASADPVFARPIYRDRLARYMRPRGGQCDCRFETYMPPGKTSRQIEHDHPQGHTHGRAPGGVPGAASTGLRIERLWRHASDGNDAVDAVGSGSRVAVRSDFGVAGRIAHVGRDTMGFVSRKPTDAMAGYCRSQLEMPEVASDDDACALASPRAAEDNGMVRLFTGRWGGDRSAPK